MWTSPHVFLINIAETDQAKVITEIRDPDSKNDHVTDLCPLPNYNPSTLPLLLKRG
jgi:hypothetical protein